MAKLFTQKSIKLFLIYLIFCSILCLVFLEIIIRFRANFLYGFDKGSISEIYKIDPKTGLRIPIPNKDIQGKRIHIKINSLGFRGDELDSTKQMDTIRLAVLGASTTFCAEVSENKTTWPEIVKIKLNEKFPNHTFEMINGGVPGYGIASSLINLRHRILHLRPDIIIVYHATNDISSLSRKAAVEQGLIEKSQNHHGSSLASFLCKHSQAFDLIYKNIAIKLRQQNADNSGKLLKFPIENVSPFVSYLDSIRIECEQNDIPLVLFTFSTKFRRKQSPKTQLKNMNTAMYYMPWMAPNTFFEAFELFNKEMFSFAQQYVNVYVDTLHNSIPGDDEHFVDSVHFTDKGSRRMAKRVYDALLHKGLIDSVINLKQQN